MTKFILIITFYFKKTKIKKVKEQKRSSDTCQAPTQLEYQVYQLEWFVHIAIFDNTMYLQTNVFSESLKAFKQTFKTLSP